MDRWAGQFSDEEMQRLAKRLEEVISKAHTALVWAAAAPADDVVEAFVVAQQRLLGFDDFTSRRFREALENQRVKTLAQGNIFLTCALTSAVALTTAKEAPRPVARNMIEQGRNYLLGKSPSPLSLFTFAVTCFYAVLGQGAKFRFKNTLSQARKTIHSK